MLRSLFAVGATNKKAIVYSTDTGDPVATFVAKGGINAVAFSGAGANARLIAGTFTSDLQMWRVENDGGEAECELKYGDIVFCMAVGADGTRLAVGGAKAHDAHHVQGDRHFHQFFHSFLPWTSRAAAAY